MLTKRYFYYSERLGIQLPQLNEDWDQVEITIQEAIITKWEQTRGAIPERIKAFEMLINERQAQLNEESDFARSCQINSDIADMASRINDLQIWFRLNQDIQYSKTHN